MASAALASDFQVSGSTDLWCAALSPPKDGRANLLSVLFHEDRPDLGEIKTVSSNVFASVAGDVQDVLLPDTNYSRMDGLVLWEGWMQTQQVSAKTSSISPVASVQLDTRATLIRPPMGTKAGEMDVFVLCAEGRELRLIRFVPGAGSATPTGSTLWKTPLPVKPLIARATLGPARVQSPRRILLGFQEPAAAVLNLYDLAGGNQLGPPTAVARLDGQSLMPGQEAALRVDDDGNTHAAVLLSSPSAPTDVTPADILFPAPSGAPQIKIGAPRKLPAKPLAATLLYSARPDRPIRRDWVALLANGNVSHSQIDGEPMKPMGLPVVPLQLVGRSQATYLLELLPDGPALEALR